MHPVEHDFPDRRDLYHIPPSTFTAAAAPRSIQETEQTRSKVLSISVGGTWTQPLRPTSTGSRADMFYTDEGENIAHGLSEPKRGLGPTYRLRDPYPSDRSRSSLTVILPQHYCILILTGAARRHLLDTTRAGIPSSLSSTPGRRMQAPFTMNDLFRASPFAKG
ncbi:hypothetical protein C8F01DRAFT_1250593 [Mycena amicta]|nr:hypothetical protein C8F01DRAFT_1250593 [Mycena amicta]